MDAENFSFSQATSPHWQIEASSGWVEADIPRRQWIVPSYLMRGKVSALIGPPEAGKSTMALKWSIALGLFLAFGDFRPVALPGREARPYRVATLNAEDDEDEQRRRISALIRETGHSVSDLRDNLIRIRPEGATAKLFEPGMSAGEVVPTEALESLKLELIRLRVDVLILDPLVELMGGADENSNAVMGAVFAMLRRLAEGVGIAILVVHHVKKGGMVPGSLEAARGGGALGGSVRVAHTLAAMTEAEADELGIPKDTRRHYVRLDSAKQSYAPPADGAVWFHRFSVEIANGETAPGLEPWQAPTDAAMSLDDLAPIEAAVKAGAEDGLPYSLKLSGDARSIKRMLEAKGVTGRTAQGRMIEALRTQCGMVNSAFQRRNEHGQKRGTNLGARIGNLPPVEWVASQGGHEASSSGSDDDEY